MPASRPAPGPARGASHGASGASALRTVAERRRRIEDPAAKPQSRWILASRFGRPSESRRCNALTPNPSRRQPEAESRIIESERWRGNAHSALDPKSGGTLKRGAAAGSRRREDRESEFQYAGVGVQVGGGPDPGPRSSESDGCSRGCERIPCSILNHASASGEKLWKPGGETEAAQEGFSGCPCGRREAPGSVARISAGVSRRAGGEARHGYAGADEPRRA
jgi:hypothetical protein